MREKRLLPKLQKKIHKTDHAPSSSRESRPPFRSSKVIPVNSYMKVVRAIPLASEFACRELRTRRRAAEARLPLAALRSLRRTAQRAFSESLAAIRY
jgi:hypothetical protein